MLSVRLVYLGGAGGHKLFWNNRLQELKLFGYSKKAFLYSSFALAVFRKGTNAERLQGLCPNCARDDLAITNTAFGSGVAH